MNILDASRMQARHYPGGIEAVAPRLNKSPSTLEKELRGANGYKWGAVDAADLSAMCAELRLPDALLYPTAVCAGSRVLLLPLPALDDMPLGECMLALAKTSKEAHELISEACADLSDGKITDNEMVRIDRAIGELMASAQAMRRAFAAANKSGKPKAAA